MKTREFEKKLEHTAKLVPKSQRELFMFEIKNVLIETVISQLERERRKLRIAAHCCSNSKKCDGLDVAYQQLGDLINSWKELLNK